MSSTGRKKYEAAFKAKVALEAVKGGKTIGQLAGEYGIHPDQIGRWKSELLEKLPGLFSSPEFTGFLESQGIGVSMGGRGRVFDNITWTGRRSPFLDQKAKPFFSSGSRKWPSAKVRVTMSLTEGTNNTLSRPSERPD